MAVKASYKQTEVGIIPEDWTLLLFAQLALAWHVAAFGRVKRLPRLERVIGRRRRKSTWQEQLKKVQQLNALFGGVDGRKEAGDGG